MRKCVSKWLVWCGGGKAIVRCEDGILQMKLVMWMRCRQERVARRSGAIRQGSRWSEPMKSWRGRRRCGPKFGGWQKIGRLTQERLPVGMGIRVTMWRA